MKCGFSSVHSLFAAFHLGLQYQMLGLQDPDETLHCLPKPKCLVLQSANRHDILNESLEVGYLKRFLCVSKHKFSSSHSVLVKLG